MQTFESIIKPIHGCKPSTDNSFTTRNAKHIPCGFCIHTKVAGAGEELETDALTFSSRAMRASPPFVFRGEKVVKTFLERLEMYAKIYYELTRPKNMKMLVMTTEDKHNFANTSVYHICEETIGEKKVRDHCHITGKYRGPAHESCNLNYKYPKFIPLYLHNLSGYDAHLFIKELAKHKLDTPHTNVKPVSIIPSNEENYISFS